MAEAKDAAPRSGKLKLILLTVVPLLLLAGGGGTAYMLGLLPFGPGAEAAAPPELGPTEGGRRAEAVEAGPVLFIDLPDVLVNLQGDGRRVRFLKLRLALEVGSERDAERIRSLHPRIMDSFQLYLRSLEGHDLEGTAAMYRLKEELLARINHAVAPVLVRDVLFREMLVQ